MTSAGNAADFGDLNFNTQNGATVTDGTYIYALDYVNVNIAILLLQQQNATDFGDQIFGNPKENPWKVMVLLANANNNAVTANIGQIYCWNSGQRGCISPSTVSEQDALRVFCKY